ncbi:MAG: hypothetical protein LBV79_02925 [Candidatus Adiutrix sp.]|nr:hypothetical protein [Candidatus Adiutrix sp.]
MSETNDEKKGGRLNSLAYFIGWWEISWFLIAVTVIAFAIFLEVIGNFDFYFEYTKTQFGQFEYAAPIATGIFLLIFAIHAFKPRKKERPVLDYIAALIVASLLTTIIIAAVSLTVSAMPVI